MRARRHGPHHRSRSKNYRVWWVCKNNRFWFFEPVEDSGRRMAVRKRLNVSAQTPASYVHSKSLLYTFTRSSLHLTPATRKGSDEDGDIIYATILQIRLSFVFLSTNNSCFPGRAFLTLCSRGTRLTLRLRLTAHVRRHRYLEAGCVGSRYGLLSANTRSYEQSKSVALKDLKGLFTLSSACAISSSSSLQNGVPSVAYTRKQGSQRCFLRAARKSSRIFEGKKIAFVKLLFRSTILLVKKLCDQPVEAFWMGEALMEEAFWMGEAFPKAEPFPKAAPFPKAESFPIGEAFWKVPSGGPSLHLPQTLHLERSSTNESKHVTRLSLQRLR